MIQLTLILTLLFSLPNIAGAQDITSGLIGHWKFDEGSGTTAADSSGNNNTGTLTNGPTWGTGKIGRAVSFDGVNNYVDVGSGDSYDVPTLTVSAWIKRSATGVRHMIAADNINSSSDASHFFYWEVNASNVLYLGFGDGVNHGSVSSTATIADTNWHHVAFYRNDATEKIQFFIDGVADGEKNYASTLGTLVTLGTNNLWIGKTNVSGFNLPFNGLIDEVRVYNRVLSSSDIQALYNLGSGPPDTQAPTVSITASANGATVFGTITVLATANDNIGVSGVQFLLDGVNLGAEDTTSPHAISWNTTTATNGSHTLTARARDAAGNSTVSSGVTVTVSNAPDSTSPSMPTDLSAIAVSSSQINLSWTASTDNVGVTGYRVERCQGSSCTNFAQIGTPTGTTHNDTGLSANATYRYRVRAADAANNLSGYSSIASGTTQTIPTGGTVLENLVANMAPGEWRTLTPNNVSAISNVANWAVYADSATWDPISKKLLFLGSYHASPYKFAIYNDADNNWNSGPQLPGIPFNTVWVGHGYDHNTIDATRGNFYYHVRPGLISGACAIYKFNIATNTWTCLTTNPLGPTDNTYDALAYFPKMGGLIWVQPSGKVFLFNENTQQWSLLTTVALNGGTW